MRRLLDMGVLIGNLPSGAIGIGAWAQPITPMLAGKLTSYQHTIADRFGFESATLAYSGDRSEMVRALGLLGRTVTTVAPSGAVMWDGIITRVRVAVAGVEHSISTDELYNRVKVRYTTRLGSAFVTATQNDTVSQARYGIKELVSSVGTIDPTTALDLAERLLKEYKNPPADMSLNLATGDAGGVGEITLEATGFYASLGYTTTSKTSTANVNSLTQVDALVEAIDTNLWISTGTIEAAGISTSEYIAPDTTHLAKIESLLGFGDSNGDPLSWGVYEDRLFHVVGWAGASLTWIGVSAFGGTRTYRLYLGEGAIRNGENLPVPWWLVRPNIAYSLDLLDVGNTNVGDGTTTGVASRVTFAASEGSMSLTLESENRSSAAARIARIGG